MEKSVCGKEPAMGNFIDEQGRNYSRLAISEETQKSPSALN